MFKGVTQTSKTLFKIPYTWLEVCWVSGIVKLIHLNLDLIESPKIGMRANYELKKVTDESLPVAAPSAHSGFGKGSLGLGLYVIKIIIGTSVCDNNHSLIIVTQVVAMAQKKVVCYKPQSFRAQTSLLLPPTSSPFYCHPNFQASMA